MYQIELEQFSGPLDLLLGLIEDQKLDISQVALAEVTDQYLYYLDNNDISALELADFLVVATKLLVIKSKTLLPEVADDEEDSAEQLEAQLKIYKDYLAASKNIEAILSRQRFSFFREKIAESPEPTFSPPARLKLADLTTVFNEILNRISYVVNLPQKVLERTVTLREMVANIKNSLARIKKINFQEILTKVSSRAEAVICFIALLELIKNGEVAVKQKGVFDEIIIEGINL
ncbi:MAG: segregation/condensation protein A [Patescibacteria group bacterium]